MRVVLRSLLMTMCLVSLGASALLAAADYTEGWDAGTVADWSRSTISCDVFGDASGGNPGGSLRIVPSNTSSIELVGARTQLPDATGDYAAGGIRRVSFDLKNEGVPVTSLWFRVRYLDEFHNGWVFHLANSVPQGVYSSYVVAFDPTWTDAEAVAAGWQQESLSPSFAETMADVFYPEVRLRVSPVTAGSQLRLDNFRLLSCAGDTKGPVATASVDRASLWPPNHKMIDVSARVGASDFCDPDPTIQLVSVTSNEPDEGLGNGDRPGDIVILGDFRFQLRAERSAHGSGRIYTITYSVTDFNGNETKVSAVVTVPVSQNAGALATGGGAFGRTVRDSRPDTDDLVLCVPSRIGGMDATQSIAGAQVGNHLGTVPAVGSQLVDANGDGLKDLAIVFPRSAVEELADRTRAEALQEMMSDPAWDGTFPREGIDAPLSLFFESNGSTWLTEDVLAPRRSVPAGVIDGEGPDGNAAGLVVPTGTPGGMLLSLPASGRLVVTVYDVLGRRTRTLIDREVGAGSLPLTWDGRDDSGRPAPAGLYYARISGPGFQGVQRVRMTR